MPILNTRLDRAFADLTAGTADDQERDVIADAMRVSCVLAHMDDKSRRELVAVIEKIGPELGRMADEVERLQREAGATDIDRPDEPRMLGPRWYLDC